MRIIRKGMFETNSSSAHSIIISNKGTFEKIKPESDGSITIEAREFGWEIEDYNSFYVKASYCLTYAKQINDESLIAILAEVISKNTGATEVVFKPWCFGSDYSEWGYIDHQSSDVCAEAFACEESLTQFLFNPNSSLHTDNDNH